MFTSYFGFSFWFPNTRSVSSVMATSVTEIYWYISFLFQVNLYSFKMLISKRRSWLWVSLYFIIFQQWNRSVKQSYHHNHHHVPDCEADNLITPPPQHRAARRRRNLTAYAATWLMPMHYHDTTTPTLTVSSTLFLLYTADVEAIFWLLGSYL